MAKAKDPAQIPARDRLFAAGAELFAERGFDGVTVREICRRAGTGINMIHHYYGSKDGLLRAIVRRFDSQVFALPMRIVEEPPKSPEDFETRIGLLFETTLEAYIAERAIMLVVLRELASLEALGTYQAKVVAFLKEGQKRGIVRQELDCAMVSGAMLDRILNQVHFAPWVKEATGDDVVNDPDYRRRWCRSNVDLFLHGMLQR